MKSKKDDIVLQYYLAKNNLRTVCLKKCLDFKDNSEHLNDAETDCLTNCSGKIKAFLNIAQDVYVRDLKSVEN